MSRNFCWPACGAWACVDRQALSVFHTSLMCAKLPSSSLIIAGQGRIKDDRNPSDIIATHLSARLSSLPINTLSAADEQLMAREHFERLTGDQENILTFLNPLLTMKSLIEMRLVCIYITIWIIKNIGQIIMSLLWWSQGNTLGTVNICTQFHSNPFT